MMEPKRLTQRPNGDPSGALLRSMHADSPAAKAKQETLAALGLLAGTAASTVVASASAASQASFSGAAAGTGSTIGTLVFAKWIAVGALGGVLAVGTAKVVESQSGSQPASPASATNAVRAPQAAATPPVVFALEPAVPPETLTSPPVPPSVGASQGPSSIVSSAAASAKPDSPAARVPGAEHDQVPPVLSSAPTPTGPSLSDELAALDRVHAALSAGSSSEALRLLDEYRLAYPRHRMEAEATVLQIQAFLAAGQREQAVRLANAFIASHPRSPMVRHVQYLIQ